MMGPCRPFPLFVRIRVYPRLEYSGSLIFASRCYVYRGSRRGISLVTLSAESRKSFRGKSNFFAEAGTLSNNVLNRAEDCPRPRLLTRKGQKRPRDGTKVSSEARERRHPICPSRGTLEVSLLPCRRRFEEEAACRSTKSIVTRQAEARATGAPPNSASSQTRGMVGDRDEFRNEAA